MTDQTQNLRVAGLNTKGATEFALQPNVAQRKAIARLLDLIELKKLRFIGRIVPTGDADWTLTGDLGGTVVQPCVVTLAPVTTRIETPVIRQFIKMAQYPQDTEENEEIEILPGEDSEPLGSHIDLAAVMSEALSLALPLYPKADGAKLPTSTYAEDGATPMTDEAARPFAALSALRDKLDKEQ